MHRRIKIGLAAALITAAPVLGQQSQEETLEASGSDDATAVPIVAPADRILQSLTNSELRELVA